MASGVKSWLLDKYAKQVEDESRNEAVNNVAETMSSKGGEVWKVNMAQMKKYDKLMHRYLQFISSARHTNVCRGT
jgi:hypothetical protein